MYTPIFNAVAGIRTPKPATFILRNQRIGQYRPLRLTKSKKYAKRQKFRLYKFIRPQNPVGRPQNSKIKICLAHYAFRTTQGQLDFNYFANTWWSYRAASCMSVLIVSIDVVAEDVKNRTLSSKSITTVTTECIVLTSIAVYRKSLQQ